LASAGLAIVIGLQAFINMGVAVSLLPAKGMTLPFISYGGSSLFAVALTMGFALGVTRQRPQLEMHGAARVAMPAGARTA
jgi:cell division protein FtsW